MIKSHISYGLSAWGPTVSTASQNRLNILIKSGLRCVAGVHKRTHSAPLLKKYGQLYLDDLIRIKICSVYLSLKSPGNQNNGLINYFKDCRYARKGKIKSRLALATSLKQANTINSVYDLLALESKPKTILSKIKNISIQKYPDSCTTNHCKLCKFNTGN